MGDDEVDPGFLPLPRVPAASLTYERFLREFALPRVPFILEGVGLDWPARKWSLDHFLSEGSGVNLSHSVTVTVSGLAGGAGVEEESTVGDALSELRRRRDSGEGDGVRYLSAWDYVRGGSDGLQRDFTVPRLFDAAPRWLAEHVVLGCAAIDMRWLYVGEAGSGSATHVDTNLSSAWLWVAHGEKEWICARGDAHGLLWAREGEEDALAGGPPEGGAVPRGLSGGPLRELPDLFAPNLFEAHPRLRRAALYRGVQRAGDVCFNPSGCVHAVRNTQPTISLTHNFVDATNYADALRDAAVTIRDELLPMVEALGPRRVLRTLQESLRTSKSKLRRTLQQLPHLTSAEVIADVVRAAVRRGELEGAEGAEGAEDAAAIEALLSSHLERSLDAELRVSLGGAVNELLAALEVDEGGDAAEPPRPMMRPVRLKPKRRSSAGADSADEQDGTPLKLTINGSEVDATAWAPRHPGGAALLRRHAGTDATEAFDAVGHSPRARAMLAQLVANPTST